MAHPRKLIRHAVVALLVGANTAAAARVQATRIEPHRKTQLPALAVYTLSESTVRDASEATSPRELQREARLEVTGWVAHSAAIPVDDAMDDLAEQIEAAMDLDPTFGGLVSDSILDDTRMQVLEENGGSDPTVGIVVLTYVVTYWSSTVEIGAAVPFLRVNATTDLVIGVADDTDPVEDTFTVQETPP